MANTNSKLNSDSDSDSDIDITSYIDLNEHTKQKVYQIQHQTDNIYKFKFMGFFDILPSVELGNFAYDTDTHCYLTSNFVFEADLKEVLLHNMITINIIKKGILLQLIMGIEFDKDINLEGDNIGSVFIAYINEEKSQREILKKNLIYPGSSKIVFFILSELRNEKIKAYIRDG
jgi:hypothetical protein